MAYATNTEVLARIPALNLGASTEPSTTDVTTLLDEISTQYDLQLAQAGYTTPITGTNSLVEMKRITLKRCIADVCKIVATGNTEVVAYWQDEADAADDMLDKIIERAMKGEQFLSDAAWAQPDNVFLARSYAADILEEDDDGYEPWTEKYKEY